MLPDRLRKARKDKKLKQQQMADILGVSRTTYVGYESDGTYHRDPGDDLLVVIAEKLEVTTDYLLGRPNDQKLTEQQDKELYEMKMWQIVDDFRNNRVPGFSTERSQRMAEALEMQLLANKREQEQK